MAYAEVKGFDSFTRMSLCVAWKSFYTIIFFIVKFFLTTTVTLSSLLSIRETWQDFSKRGHTVSNKGHSPDCPPSRV